MSKIKADTLSNLGGTKEVPVDTVVQGSAKAWVNFNGTGTVAIRAAFNVSSITDGGTGVYTINFAEPLAHANYALAASTSVDADAVVTVSEQNNSAATRDPAGTSSVRVALISVRDIPTEVDRYSVSVSVLA